MAYPGPGEKVRVRWGLVGAAVAVFAAVVLWPVWWFFLGIFQPYVYPRCVGYHDVHVTGEHAGYRIGMSRAAALARVRSERPLDQVAVLDPEKGDWREHGTLATRTTAGSREKWLHEGRRSACIMARRRLWLQFTDGQLVKIEDELSWAGP